MAEHGVEFLLIGGVNFLLRHQPVLTFDVDLWIEDTEANRGRCEGALGALEAAWGPQEHQWRPVGKLPPGWLAGQAVFCLTSPHGAIDIFRSVRGLDDWREARRRAVLVLTGGGVAVWALSDEDMLACQTALPPEQRKQQRTEALRRAIDERRAGNG